MLAAAACLLLAKGGAQKPKQSACKLSCTHVYSHIYMRKTESTEDVRRWFAGVIRDLWPVAVGSLSLRKGPCIRPNCPACASGKGHSSYALYGRRGNRRFSIYVPERLVPEVRTAIQNGRKLQELINQAGVRYVKALKRQDSTLNK
jgi:hypothetical protein